MAIITIFGLAGTGTSTCGKLLAEKLNYKFISTGGIFRQVAAEKGLTLYEYEKLLHNNRELDREFDERIREIGKTEDNLVVESRLAWYFIPHSIKVKFVCDDEVRFGRVAQRDGISVDEAKEKTLFREGLHKERYFETYGLEDYGADEHFEHIINTTNISPEQIVENIKGFLK